MSNDLLKQLEAKINEAIETIEFSRMEITDLKEKNDELENRYEDWEQRLSSLIEKFEQLEAVEVEAEVDKSIQKDEEAEEVVAEEAKAEEVEAEEVEAEEVVAVETEDEEAEADTEEFEGDEIEGSTFGTSADSYTEAPGSSQHYA
ncbi:MAG: cell division protein ZapB [SAR324 cluster bacterium]|nr:cell division protein ZapB [SAR324 cluster bacterium]